MARIPISGNLEAVAAAWAEHDAKKRRKTGAPPPPPPSLTPPAPATAQEEKKPRKKMDRFGGMDEEEVAKRTLPDHLKPGLDIVIVSCGHPGEGVSVPADALQYQLMLCNTS